MSNYFKAVNQASRVLSMSALLLVGSCAWGRFDKLRDDSPIVRLLPADDYNGKYGVGLAFAGEGSQAELYVSGAPGKKGGLVYSLGTEGRPGSNPTDKQHCPLIDSGNSCAALGQAVGLTRSWAPGGTADLCFISGFGSIGSSAGLWARCDDGLQMIFAVPPDLETAFEGENAGELRLATNRFAQQLVLVGAQSEARAWYYEPLSGEPLEIPAPMAAGDDFGSMVAVGKLTQGHLLAVSSLSTNDVWLFRADSMGVSFLSCLEGGEEFGRTLATGDVDSDGQEDLVVASENKVTVFSAAKLLELADTGSCDSGESAQVATLICETSEDTRGCGASDFGAALAVGDLDGDDKGEVLVGAPSLNVRDSAGAGGVLIYDATGKLTETVIVADIDERARFGASVGAVRQIDHDILVVGASGSREVYLHYCAGGADGGKRCE